MIEKNKGFLEYTYLHRKAFAFLVETLIKNPDDKKELRKRAEVHDLDKSLMYTMLEKKDASEIHRSTARHHMENDGEKDRYDFIEAVLDYECAALTKPDKPLNAYDTVLKYRASHVDELMGIMKELGIDYSYVRKPDAAFEEFMSRYLPVTEEKILGEIYSYISSTPDAAYYVYLAIEKANENGAN